MGSDFTNDDLVKESSLLLDYDGEVLDSPDEGLYLIRLKAKEETPTVWAKIELSVRKSDLIPIEEVYFDEKGKPMREMKFADVKVFDGRKLPSLIELVPLAKEGYRTTIRYLDAQFDRKLDRDVFTMRNLRRRR